MAVDKMKSESYQNLGGINLKASPFLTGPQEFLNLVNFDFQTPGSLTKRWGSTQYFTQSYTGTIQSLYEYNKLSGASQIMIGVSGGLWAGATNGQLQGLSLTYISASPVSYDLRSAIPTQRVGAYTGFTLTMIASIFEGNTGYIQTYSAGQLAGTGQQQVLAAYIKSNRFSFVTINNLVYFADGNNFLYYDGTTTCPAMVTPPTNAILETGSTRFLPVIGSQPSITFPGFSAGLNYFFYAGVQTKDGRSGPVYPIGVLGLADGIGATLSADFGSTQVAVTHYIGVPLWYGASGINLYWAEGGTLSFNTGITYTNSWDYVRRMGIPPWLVSNLNYIGTIPITGSTIVPTMSAAGNSFLMSVEAATFTANFSEIVPFDNKLISFGQTYTAPLSVWTARHELNNPRFLEVYNNQLFCAGFSLSLSTVHFSDIGAPSSFDIENNFEVRTNDGDYITGLKSYQSALMIFKNNSYHQLTGDDPTNFTLRQVSDSYGCVNHWCTAIYEDYLVFLDRKGIIRHNGANQQTISAKIQDVFDSMNYSAAQNVACMAHDKKRNQILTAIPINGATFNNITVVYDYLVDAWTKYEGYNPSLFAVLTGNLSSRTLFYGGYTGNIYNFGASFFGDNGVGFTTLYKTRYLSEIGSSVEKQFRRLYINCDNNIGSGTTFNLVFYPSYGPTIGFTAAMSTAAYQSRIDFGVSTKALSYELSNFGATLPVKVHGYVLEYRFQRNV